MIESPSLAFAGKRRDGSTAPADAPGVLDAHLVIMFTAAFDYAADTGGLPAWTAKKTGR